MIGLDVHDLRSTDASRHRDAIEAIGQAGRSIGAFSLRAHGLDPALIARTFGVMREFYALPQEVRLRYAAEEANFRGYQPLPTVSGDMREKFLVTTRLGARDASRPNIMPGENRWPAEVDGFRETVEECQRELTMLGRVVLQGIAESLGLSPGAFDGDFTEPGGSCLWLLHYPATPTVRGQPAQGTSPHSDLHPLAIIVQDDQEALDVLCDGSWSAVDPARDPIVCQMGDTIARWSNDRFRPNVHRVRSPVSRSRYSLALFMQPAFDSIIAPVETCVTGDRPARYPPQTFAECLAEWFNAIEEGRAGYVPGV